MTIATKRIKVNSRTLELIYRENTAMHAHQIVFNKEVYLTINIYDVVGEDNICLIACTDMGVEYITTATVITKEKYESILKLWYDYLPHTYHSTLVNLVKPKFNQTESKKWQQK